MINVLLICGVSGSGKSFVTNNLVKWMPDKYKKLIQYTTRSKRHSESINEYYFVSEKHFLSIKDNLMAINYMNGNYYGTVPDLIEDGKTSIIIVNDQGIRSSLEYLSKLDNIKVCVLFLDVEEAYEKRPDERNIEEERKNLFKVFEELIPDTNLLKLSNSRNNPLMLIDVDRQIENLFEEGKCIEMCKECKCQEGKKCECKECKCQEGKQCKCKEEDSEEDQKCNCSFKIECDWITCIHNHHKICKNPKGIKLAHITVDHEDENSEDDSLLKCINWQYDECWNSRNGEFLND